MAAWPRQSQHHDAPAAHPATQRRHAALPL